MKYNRQLRAAERFYHWIEWKKNKKKRKVKSQFQLIIIDYIIFLCAIADEKVLFRLIR